MAVIPYISTQTGISTAIIEANDELEKYFTEQNIFAERERMMLDREWLKKLLQQKPGIAYLRVVKKKPEGGIFIKRRYYFDAFLVKRNVPCTPVKRWMVYLVIPSR